MKVPIASIIIPPDRQRRIFDEKALESLTNSIRSLGLLQPILISVDNELIAGERRLRACKALGFTEIEAHRFREEGETASLEFAQLEENVRRSDLTWQESAYAYAKLHNLLKAEQEGWSLANSCAALGVTPYHLNASLQVAHYLRHDPEKILHCADLSSAFNIIQRIHQRAVEKEADVIQEQAAFSIESLFADPKAPVHPTRDTGSEPRQTEGSILQANFHEWASDYSGKPFNFLHIDFPYGININKSEQASSADWQENYADSEDTYWDLLESLSKNYDKIVAPSAHIMFWFSMKFFFETVEFFQDNLPEDTKCNPFPLIWVKSDGSGILPDAKRGPRRIYETALILTRGDRFIVKPIANAHSAPQGKKIHLSEKPQPVLRHFFQMFLDENSRVLDPTCGCGNALAVAEEFKVKSVLGLDLDPVSIETAKGVLKKARIYAKMDKVTL